MGFRFIRDKEEEEELKRRSEELSRQYDANRKNYQQQAQEYLKNSNINWINPNASTGGLIAKNFGANFVGNITNKLGAPFQSTATGVQQGINQRQQEQSTWDTIVNTAKNIGNVFSNIDPASKILYKALNWQDTKNEIYNLANNTYNNYKTLKDTSQQDTTWDKVQLYGKTAGSVFASGTGYVANQLNPVSSGFTATGKYSGALLDIINKEDAEQSKNKLLEIDKNINYYPDKWKQEVVADSSLKNDAEQKVINASGSIGNMTPDILLGFALGGAGMTQAEIEGVTLSSMGASAKGEKFREELNKGTDIETAEFKANASATKEVATEKLTGGFHMFSPYLKKSGAEKVAKNYIGKVLNKIVNVGKDISGEIKEEIIADVYDMWLDRATTDPNANYTLDQAIDTAVTTALSTGGLNTIYGGLNKVNTVLDKTYKNNQDIIENKKEITPEIRQESDGYKTTLQGMINNLDIPQQIKDEIQPMLDSNAVVTKEDFDGLKESIKDIVKNNGQIQKMQLLKQAYNTTAIDNQIESLNQLTPEKFNNQESRQFYAKQMNKDFEDYKALNEITSMFPTNRNGKWSIKQFEEIAKLYGKNMADRGLAPEQVRTNTVQAWQYYDPYHNQATYDKTAKKSKKQNYYNEQWSKSVYNSYKEAMKTQLEQQQEQATSEEVLNPQLEAIDDNTNILLDTIDSFNASEQVSEQVKESLLESAERYGFKGKTLNEIQKAMEKRGISSRFDDTKFNDSRVGSFYDPDNNEIVFNPNASEEQIIQELAVHEWYHELKQNNTEEATKIQEDIINYLKRNNQYADIRKNLEKTYIEQGYDKNRPDFTDMIDEEATAKALQQVLGNEEEIQRLNNYNRNLARRIYDAVVNLLNKFTGGRNEKLFWTNVRNNFERVFNTPGTAKENNQSNNQKRLSTDTESQEQGSFNLPINKITDDNKLKMTYVRMNNQDTQNYGDTYGQNIEPSGEYMSMDTMQGKYKVPGAEYGTITFENPLVLEHKDTTANGWKKDLSERYNNLTGKKLSNAIMKDGYDAIVTQDEKGNVIEVVNLNGNKETNNNNTKYSASTSNQPTTDNQGRTLTKEQQEYLKDSSKELLTKTGRPQRWYHTTSNNIEAFNEFNPVGTPGYKFGDQVVIFATNNKTMSESYADDFNNKPVKYNIKGNEGKHKYIYEGYLKAKNPYVVDSNNRGYGQANIRLNEQQEKAINIISKMTDKEINTAKKLQEQALERFLNGDERVKALNEIRNDLKSPGFEDEKLAIDVGSTMQFVEDAEKNGTKTGEALEKFRQSNEKYAKNLIKQAYPNYDDFLINITFDNLLYDYNNKTLNYSNSNIGDILKIDKSLTLKEINELLNTPDYSNDDVISIFKELVDKSDLSEDIKNLSNMEVANFKNEHTTSKYYKTGLNNLYSALAWKDTKDTFNVNTLKEFLGESVINETTNDVIKRVLKMNEEGANYDAVLFKNLYDYGGVTTEGGTKSGDVVAFFNSNQFKDINNTNPTDNPDIRYSKKTKFDEALKENIETTNNGKNLLALHNLSEDKLRGVLELGGFPVPSIAVTNPDKVNHKQFGDISVVFNKDTINPENRANEVYDRDVWSPTFPQVDYQLNDEGIDKTAEQLGIEDWRLKDYAEDSSKPEYLVDSLSRNESVVDKYIKDNNLEYETAYKESEISHKINKDEQVKKWIRDNDITAWKLAQNEDLRNEYYNLAELNTEEYQDYVQQLNNVFDKYLHDGEMEQPRFLWSFARDFNTIKNENDKVVDDWQTNKNKREVAEQNGIKEYLQEQVKNIYGEKGIRNDADIFTSSGNRRSFWQLHDEYNLENIVDALTKQDTQGTQNWIAGYGQIQAKMGKQFKSISDIKANENMLTNLSEENTELTTARDNLEADIDEIVAKNDTDYDIVSELLADFAGGELTVENFKNLTKNYYQTTQNVPDKLINKIIKDLNNLKNLPTDYFEAKPQRAVTFDEIDTVVLPSDTSADIKQQLTDRGINYIEYDRTDENARNNILKSLDQYKFSKKSQDFDSWIKENLPKLGNKKTKLSDLKVPTKKEANLPTQKLSANTNNRLSKDTLNRIDELKQQNKEIKERYSKQYSNDKQLAEKKIKGRVMQNLAEIRELTQGDLLIPVEGGLTEIELANKIKKLKSNYVGKEVIVNNKEGVITGNSFGKVGVEFKDGTQSYYDPSDIKPVVDIDSIIAEQEKNKPIETYEKVPTNNNQKQRKTFKSIIESNETSQESKEISMELLGSDTYTPDSNEAQLRRADNLIESYGADKMLDNITVKADSNTEKTTATDIAVGNRLIQYYSKIGDKENLTKAIQSTALLGTNAGQQVQAMSLIKRLSPEGQALYLQREVAKFNEKLARRKGGDIVIDENGNQRVITKNGKDITDKVKLFDLTPDMLQRITNATEGDLETTIDQIYEELGQQVPLNILEQLDEWRYFSMLANVRTHARNSIGNLAMHFLQYGIKDKIGAVGESIANVFDKDMERTKTLKRASKETKQFVINDLSDSGVKTRLGLQEDKYNPKSRLAQSRKTFKSDLLNKTLGELFNVNSKALEFEDGLGLKAGYYKAMTNYITANNIDVNNMTNAQLEKARAYAIQSAQESTFHQASALATAIDQFANKNRFFKLTTDALIPFKKTPINVAKTGFAYSPAGLVRSIYDISQLRKGNITVNQYIDNMAKGLTGTGVAVLGMALAKAGLLKASGDDDKDKENYEEQQGLQQYSLKIGDKTYSLDWLAPAGMALFVGAEIEHELSKDTETTTVEEENSKIDKIVKRIGQNLNSMTNVINPMNEMSMISGLTSALQSYNSSNSSGSIADIFTSSAKSYIGQYVPTVLGQFAKTTDEYERSTKSTKTGTVEKAVDQLGNQIKSKIPGLRQTLPIKTDIWGKDMKQEANLPLRAFNNFINPATVKNISDNTVDSELNKLYAQNQNSGILPDVLDKTFTIDGQKYRMNNKQYAEATKSYGETSYKMIETLVKSNDYKNMTTEQKEQAIENIYSYAKEQNKLKYAKQKGLEVEETTLSKGLNEVKKQGGNPSQYLTYTVKTKGMEKSEQKNYLANTNFSNKTKQIIYENTVGKDDDFYLNTDTMLDINEYLNYKTAGLTSDKDENGKTIKNSLKNNKTEWINQNISGYENRLLLMAEDYKLSRAEQETLLRYINMQSNAEDIFNLLDKNYTVKNGRVYYK